MAVYATPDDIEARWRPLSAEERDRAQVLASDASIRLRLKYPTLDARLTSGDLDPEAAAMVVAGMVKRAMLAPSGEAVVQQSQQAGPFGVQQTFSNPMGNLYVTAEDDAILRDPASARRGRAFSLDLTPGA